MTKIEDKSDKQEIDYKKISIAYLILSIIVSIILKIFFDIEILQTLRFAVGLILILFLPGFITLNLFFRDVRTNLEELVFSVLISIMVIILVVLFLNIILKVKITTLSSIITVLLINMSLFIFYIIKTKL